MSINNRHHLLFLISLIVIGFIYLQGVSNELLLDDVGNLEGLSTLKAQPGIEEFLAFIFHNMGTSSGRPVSFLSFALQVNDWPNGIALKQVNIFLHLLNGVLVYSFIHLLLSHIKYKRPHVIAYGIAILWLILPIQVDTVQYVIQRMTILSTSFMLLGLIVYISIRKQTKPSYWRYGLFIFFLIAAIFSKENGLLLTALVLLLEFSVFRKSPRPGIFKFWFLVSIVLPIILFFIYMAYRYQSFFLYTYRGFNAYERVLTQAHVVAHYLSTIIAPDINKMTLFYENFPISRSIFEPSTILYIALHCTILCCGILSIRKYPLIGLGILFFYLSHLMESTFLQLELYFEHRNYLAVIGFAMMLFGIVYHLSAFVQAKFVRNLVLGIPVFFILLSGWVNYQQNLVWANPARQSYDWYQKNPASHRAHGHYGMILTKLGLFHEAASHYKDTLEQFPDDPTKPLLWLEVSCNSQDTPSPSSELLLHRAEHGTFYKVTTAIIYDFVRSFEAGYCSNVSQDLFLQILDAFLKNKRYRGKHRQNLLVSKYRIHQLHNDYLPASQALEQALIIEERLDILLGLAEKYILLAKHDKALQTIKQLDFYCKKHSFKCSLQKNNIMYLKQLMSNTEK